uniref:Uncharacterized protein n=1 Tax=Vitis vinifera TaxID=29760 RepID=A5AV86_VITVI|nr:hypothetical protein VITISV_012128 [Vitis vinifera]
MGSLLGVFGCTAFVHVHNQHRDKLDPRAIKCVVLGYSSTQKGYKCYNPSSRKFYISTDVTFTENKPFFPKSFLQEEIPMMEDSPCESFEPLDLPHVSTHGDEEPESSDVDCKWIFTVKYKADGSLERHKARLVAKGYTQTYGVDFQETFAPVAKMNTIRIPLSLAAHYNWQLLQYDVKNAFLHGDLDEEIYMNIPPGFERNTGNKVCKLKKAFYGLKQSPRAWLGRFAKVTKESGYKQSLGDHTLFIKHSVAGGVIVLLVYVDDIIVIGNDKREKHEVKQRLATKFEIKELGKLKYFLSIEMAYSTQGIFISQQKYVTDLLAETGKIGCSLVDRRSTSGYCTFLGGNLVTWRSKKQNVVARSSAESDFRVIAQGLCELLWLKIILDDLRIKWDGPMKLYCDNKSTINIAHNPIQHDRTKHIEIDRHFIKEKLEEGVVCMPYVPSEHQLVHILTKGLNSSMFHDLVFKLGMEDIYSLA